MVQNRKKLIDLFIGNVSNFIIHEILEKAIDNKELSNRYNKELLNSLKIAKNYREKINPIKNILPDKDIRYIKKRLTNKVKSELRIRIKKGYQNINLNLVEELVDKALKEMGVI